MQLTVEKIKNGAKQLSKEELKDVKTWVDSLLENEEKKPKMTEEEFLKKLEAEGFIGKIPPPITDFSRYEDYEPVRVTGEPISEMIIRERR